MKCAYHPDRDSKTQCESCKKLICWECSVAIGNEKYCKNCISTGQVGKVTTPYPNPYPYQYPYPYPYQTPYPYYYPYPEQPPKEETKTKQKDVSKGIFTISGTMLIIVGLLGLLTPLIIFSLYLPSIPFFTDRELTVPIWISLCFIVPLILSLLAILGGILAMQRKNLPMVFLGTICGILSWGFFIGSIISIIVLIFLLFFYEDLM